MCPRLIKYDLKYVQNVFESMRELLALLRSVFPPQFPFLNLLACLAGLLVGTVHNLKRLFLNPDCGPVQSECTPLGWFYEILVFVGNASIPVSLINLGAALGQMKGLEKGVSMTRAVLPATVMKLIVMPAVAIPIIQSLTGIWIPTENKMLRFIMMFDSAIPVANLIVAIAQLVGPTGEAGDAASLALVQYLASAATMTVCVAVILWILGQG
jgi:predicted permease